jgi:hypothetical protein
MGENLDAIIASSEPLSGTPALAHDAIAYYQTAADATVGEAVGAENVQDFYTWAKQNHGSELKRAAIQQYHTHRTDAYAPLLERYLRQNEPSAAATRAAGLTTFGKDDELVTIGGLTMTRKVAARSGLL